MLDVSPSKREGRPLAGPPLYNPQPLDERSSMKNVLSKLTPVNAPQEMRANRLWVNWNVDKARPKMPVPRKTAKKFLSFEEAITKSEHVGYMLRGGIACLDFDKVISEDGVVDPEYAEALDELATRGYVEVSPSGRGYHAFIRVPESTRTQKSAFLPKVELLAEGSYVTVTGNQLVGSPSGIIDASDYLSLWFKPKEKKVVSLPPPAAAPERIARALSFISPDVEYPIWVEVGQALQAELGPGGFAVWDQWSSKGEKYDGTATTRVKWNSFKGQGITIASLFHHAKGGGWREKGDDAATDFAAFKEDVGPVEDAGPGTIADSYVFVAEQDRYFSKETRALLTRSALNSLHRDELANGLAVVRMNSKGEAKQQPVKNVHEYIDEECVKADAVVWYPGRPLMTDFLGKRCANIFRAPPVIVKQTQTAGTAKLWREHLEYLLPVKEEREHFLNVMAYGVQHLDGKVNHALVLFDPTGGTGKDVMLTPFRRWLEAGGWRDVQLHELDGGFQQYLYGTKFLCVQESKEMEHGRSVDLSNRMKNTIAAPPDTLTVNLKNVKPFEVPNLVQTIFLTNYQNGVYFETGEDRRYWVTNTATVPRPAEHYARLCEWMEGGWPEVIGWLASRDLSAFNPKAAPPQTTAKMEMHKATRPASMDAIDTTIQGMEQPFTIGELRMRLNGTPAASHFAGDRRAAMSLDALGCNSTRCRWREGGKDREATIWWRTDELDEGLAKAAYAQRMSAPN
jgi:hypothetical protein